MKPYFTDGLRTIYHGDCREILPSLDLEPCLLLTDPPYGMAYQPARDGRQSGPAEWERGEAVTGDKVPFDPAHLLGFSRLVLFGANWYADRLPASGGWLVWDKTPAGVREGFIYSHAELAWTNCIERVQKFPLEWQGASRNGEAFLHPTQKPVALMRWIIQRFGDDRLIADPYMGSGPVGVAAKELGRRYIGIEVEERYCEVAAKRLAQDLLFEEAVS